MTMTEVAAAASYSADASAQQIRCIFCAQCGTLIDEPTHVGAAVACSLCGSAVAASVFDSLVQYSESADRIVEPDLEEASVGRQEQRVRAVVKEPCPKCKHPELSYYTMQLRSADEGQTVFYECAKCGHTFSTNT